MIRISNNPFFIPPTTIKKQKAPSVYGQALFAFLPRKQQKKWFSPGLFRGIIFTWTE